VRCQEFLQLKRSCEDCETRGISRAGTVARSPPGPATACNSARRSVICDTIICTLSRIELPLTGHVDYKGMASRVLSEASPTATLMLFSSTAATMMLEGVQIPFQHSSVFLFALRVRRVPARTPNPWSKRA